MPVVRGYRLALEVGLLTLAASLVAIGMNAGLRLALDDAAPAAERDEPSAAAREPAPLEDYAMIAARDVFSPATGAPRGEAAGTLRLWGVGLFGGEARAVIEDTGTRRQDLFRLGDEIGGARLAAIDWDRVTLARGGAEEVLELSTAPGAPSPDAAPAAPGISDGLAPADPARIRRTGANAFVVDRRELSGAVDNMSGLLTQLRAVAEVEDGRPVGFRLFRIHDDSIFSRLGLRNGDVVQRVNGNTIGEPAALLGFLQRLRTEPRVALDIVRSGTPQTLVYDLR